MSILIEEIAHIRTPFSEKFGIPRQSGIAAAEGTIIFVPKYRQPDSLRGISDFSRLWLIWGFSESRQEGFNATVAPPRLGGRKRLGVFATRSPFRPNPLALSCVELKEVRHTNDQGDVLIVSGVDMLSGSPIYDIKPYLPYADAHPDAAAGFTDAEKWQELAVEIPDALLKRMRPEARGVVRSLLAQDPRTRFIHDENRVWGLNYAEYNIRFRVRDGLVSVLEIEIIEPAQSSTSKTR